ncbi:flavodoxin family protein [Eubacteriales bacterium OttesenSCG-928-M02]|nr:flavodoxin family protein [Eubacteriales bacterium OttesenSCG-928-M02]
MKVVAVNGSPRANGNTYHGILTMAKELEKQGIETEILQIGTAPINGCTVCGGCRGTGASACVLGGDFLPAYVEKMVQADGIILGSPVYYGSIAGNMKSFLDRAFYASAPRFRHKIGYAVTAVRRAGGLNTFQQLVSYFNLAEMVLAPTTYWGIGYGGTPGQVEEDTEGQDTFSLAAQNMAWLMTMKEQSAVSPPAPMQKRGMNFIR